MSIERSEEEIEEMIYRAQDTQQKLWGMTYEQGVQYALEWVLGSDDEPIEEE